MGDEENDDRHLTERKQRWREGNHPSVDKDSVGGTKPLRRSGTFDIPKDATVDSYIDPTSQQNGVEFRIGGDRIGASGSDSGVDMKPPSNNTLYPYMTPPSMYPGLISPPVYYQGMSPYQPMMPPFSPYMLQNLPLPSSQPTVPTATTGMVPVNGTQPSTQQINGSAPHTGHPQDNQNTHHFTPSLGSHNGLLTLQHPPGSESEQHEGNHRGSRSSFHTPSNSRQQMNPYRHPTQPARQPHPVNYPTRPPPSSYQPNLTNGSVDHHHNPQPSHHHSHTHHNGNTADHRVSAAEPQHSPAPHMGSTTDLRALGGEHNTIRVREKEQQRQIAQLLAELDRTKMINKKLEEELKETKKQLELVKINQKTKEAELNANMANKSAGVLEEIYKAQKDRDQSILERLKAANHERDEAVIRLNKIQNESMHSLRGSTDMPNMDLSKLLKQLELGDVNPADLPNFSRQLYSSITEMASRKAGIADEELHSVLKQRDEAETRCEELKAEVLGLERKMRMNAPDEKQHGVLQAQLLATQQERDLALAQVRKQDEEMEKLKVYYSLHKSLSQEKNLRDHFNHTLAHVEGQLQNRDHTLDRTQRQNNQLLAQLKQTQAELKELRLEQINSQTQRKEAEQNVQKMERLVNVLRRKISELSSQ